MAVEVRVTVQTRTGLAPTDLLGALQLDPTALASFYPYEAGRTPQLDTAVANLMWRSHGQRVAHFAPTQRIACREHRNQPLKYACVYAEALAGQLLTTEIGARYFARFVEHLAVVVSPEPGVRYGPHVLLVQQEAQTERLYKSLSVLHSLSVRGAELAALTPARSLIVPFPPTVTRLTLRDAVLTSDMVALLEMGARQIKSLCFKNVRATPEHAMRVSRAMTELVELKLSRGTTLSTDFVLALLAPNPKLPFTLHLHRLNATAHDLGTLVHSLSALHRRSIVVHVAQCENFAQRDVRLGQRRAMTASDKDDEDDDALQLARELGLETPSPTIDEVDMCLRQTIGGVIMDDDSDESAPLDEPVGESLETLIQTKFSSTSAQTFSQRMHAIDAALARCDQCTSHAPVPPRYGVVTDYLSCIVRA